MTQEPIVGDSLHVHLRGIVRGVEIDRDALIAIGHDALTVSWPSAAPWQLGFEQLEGMLPGNDLLTLYLQDGDLLEIRGDATLPTFTARLVDAVHGMPELTRGLRSLGSLRGSPGAAHDRWFAPLLSVRRHAVSVADPVRQVALFDAQALRREVDRAIEEIAVTNSPAGGAHQRALEAALEEEAEPLFAALAQLETRARRVTSAPADSQLVEWREWLAALRDVFAAADEGWMKCALVLRHGP